MAANTKTKRICPKGHQYFKSSDCPVCPICEMGRKPKDGMLAILSAPARSALENKGIRNADQLTSYTEKEILSLHGMGASSIPKLKKFLNLNGKLFKL